jgi:hypothetical protein
MAGTVVGDWVMAADGDGIDLVGRKEMDGLGRVNSASGKLWFEIASSIHSPAWRPRFSWQVTRLVRTPARPCATAFPH